VGTKLDIAGNREKLGRLENYCRMEKIDFFPVSAVTHNGIEKLLSYLSITVEKIKKRKLH